MGFDNSSKSSETYFQASCPKYAAPKHRFVILRNTRARKYMQNLECPFFSEGDESWAIQRIGTTEENSYFSKKIASKIVHKCGCNATCALFLPFYSTAHNLAIYVDTISMFLTQAS